MGDIVNMFNKPKEAKPKLPEHIEKRVIFLSKMQTGVTHVVFDARPEDVRVPPDLKDKTDLILKFSYKFTPGDVSMDDEGVKATLSFGSVDFLVSVPWGCIWRIENVVWPDSVPPEVTLVINPPPNMNNKPERVH